MSREQDVIVLLEASGENAEEINRRCLSTGSQLASRLGGNLSAMILGTPPDSFQFLQDYSVFRLYCVEATRLSAYSGEIFSWAARQALKQIRFRLLLLAHTDRGAELAPRIALYLDTSAVTDCVDIRVRGDDVLYARLVYGGQFEQEVSFATRLPEVATIRPDAFGDRGPGGSKPVTVYTIPVDIPPEIVGSTSLEIIPPDYRTVDILYAKRIIGAGAGCASHELLHLVEELSHLLEGSVATTRPVVDDGYLPKERMIGQTGKTVVPELYLALGISGSPHHVAGIQQTTKILSVNSDPRAPVFDVSDAGFVCDLSILLPELISRIKRYRDEGSV